MLKMTKASVSKSPVVMELKLDGDCFCAGQMVTGRLIVSTPIALHVKSLHVQIVGIAKSRCFGSDSQFVDNETIDQTYYNSDRCLLVEDTRLNSGYSSFTLMLQVPLYCPSSFIDKKGLVQYWCSATLESDEGQSKASANIKIQGLSPDFDLLPRGQVKKRGKSVFNAQLIKSSFVPGEMIECQLDTIAHGKEIESIETKLIEKRTFTQAQVMIYPIIDAREGTRVVYERSHKKEEIVLATIASHKPALGGTRWNTKVTIPQSATCSFQPKETEYVVHPVTVEHYLKIKVFFYGIHRRIKMLLPLMIGCYNSEMINGGDDYVEPPPPYEESWAYAFEEHAQVPVNTSQESFSEFQESDTISVKF